MKSRSKSEATGSIILISTICARMLTFSQLLGNASLSNIDVETLKNCDKRVAKLSRPSISKLDSRKFNTCFRGDDRTRTRNTIAVSPSPGLKIGLASLANAVLEIGRFVVGSRDIRENGYDSGKVTGTGIVVVAGDLVSSTARRLVGLWNSRYESSNLMRIIESVTPGDSAFFIHSPRQKRQQILDIVLFLSKKSAIGYDGWRDKVLLQFIQHHGNSGDTKTDTLQPTNPCDVACFFRVTHLRMSVLVKFSEMWFYPDNHRLHEERTGLRIIKKEAFDNLKIHDEFPNDHLAFG